jgi:hypothetical protein
MEESGGGAYGAVHWNPEALSLEVETSLHA